MPLKLNVCRRLIIMLVAELSIFGIRAPWTPNIRTFLKVFDVAQGSHQVHTGLQPGVLCGLNDSWTKIMPLAQRQIVLKDLLCARD